MRVRLFYALEWLSDMQMNNVDFVVDSKTTNDAFHFPIYKLSVGVQHTTSRQANEVTHALVGETALSTSP